MYIHFYHHHHIIINITVDIEKPALAFDITPNTIKFKIENLNAKALLLSSGFNDIAERKWLVFIVIVVLTRQQFFSSFSRF